MANFTDTPSKCRFIRGDGSQKAVAGFVSGKCVVIDIISGSMLHIWDSKLSVRQTQLKVIIMVNG
jgi:hypothetical protein